MINSLLFWLILIFGFYMAYVMGTRNAMARAAAVAKPPPVIPPEKMTAMESRLAPLLVITGRKAFGDMIQFEGHPKGKADEVFRKIRAAFAGEPVTPVMLEGEENDVRVVMLPGPTTSKAAAKPKWWLHWLLFLATLATTTWAGALHAGVNLLQQPERFAVGLPYSLGLLLILGAHELGHYFTAKAHGIRVTPPFFIPVPFALGTFGAFIKIKSRHAQSPRAI